MRNVRIAGGGIGLMLALALAGCMDSAPPPRAANDRAVLYVSDLVHDADVMLVYLRSLSTFPVSATSPPPQQTATAGWALNIRAQAKIMEQQNLVPSGYERLAADYTAVGHDIEHMLDLYTQGSPDTTLTLMAVSDKLNAARREAADAYVALVYNEGTPTAGVTPTP